MMKKKLLVLLIVMFSSCTPFDSNKTNHKLIQGKWVQVDLVTSKDNKSAIEEDISPQNASLYFWGDSCLEQIRDIAKERYFNFEINSFIISLKEEAHPITYLKIAKLTNDSLILHTESKVFRYAKDN